MSTRIPPIIDGHDGGSCFWIMPVQCHSTVCFGWDSVEECKAGEISVDEDDVFGFLKYFFFKYFDENLIYNQQRRADWGPAAGICEPAVFEWYLTHNFYTYAQCRKMLSEIAATADLLEHGGLHSVSEEITKDYNAWLLDEDIQHKMLPEENRDR